MGASTSTPGACINGGIAQYAGRNCSMQCGTDYPGGDYKQIGTNDFLGCLQACASDTQCVDAQFDRQNGVCFMKDILTSAQSASDIDSAICIVQQSQPEESTTTAFITTTQVSTATSTEKVTETATSTVTTVLTTTETSIVTSTQPTTVLSPTTTTAVSTMTSTVTSTLNLTTTLVTTVFSSVTSTFDLTSTESDTTTIIDDTTTTVISSAAPITITVNENITTTVTPTAVTSTVSITSTIFSSPACSSVNPHPVPSDSLLYNMGFEQGLDNWSFISNSGNITSQVVTSVGAVEGCRILQVTPHVPVKGFNATFGTLVPLNTNGQSSNLYFLYGIYDGQSVPSSTKIQVSLNDLVLTTLNICASPGCVFKYGGGISWGPVQISLPPNTPFYRPGGDYAPDGSYVPWPQDTAFLKVGIEWFEGDAGNSSIVFDRFYLHS